ncbi:pyridoxal-dependent decarboxylase domain-containing protein 1-like [Heteronotia binoei]|uniref:pyridoxal-dependent decarboxylase domain-containing protein 1-like n=1 Tax=Heteronotia binoei TaxID=13085 RepID=UPI00292EEEAD|nr:pyridoxal-dependent decarboxylase domain-containing protein 1-like [Heteronotia binoei]
MFPQGLLRQIPVVGSVLNWFSPFHASPKGRTFDLTAGSLELTEPTYVSKVQGTGITPPPTPTSARAKQRLPGQKLFKRSMRSSDGFSETSSVSHTDDLVRGELSPGPSSAGQGNPELSEAGVHLTEEADEDSAGEMVQTLGNTGTKSEEQESLR